MKVPKHDLRPFFQRNPWAVPITGVVMGFLSPILFPVAVVVLLKNDIFAIAKEYYYEAKKALTFTGFEDE